MMITYRRSYPNYIVNICICLCAFTFFTYICLYGDTYQDIDSYDLGHDRNMRAAGPEGSNDIGYFRPRPYYLVHDTSIADELKSLQGQETHSVDDLANMINRYLKGIIRNELLYKDTPVVSLSI